MPQRQKITVFSKKSEKENGKSKSIELFAGMVRRKILTRRVNLALLVLAKGIAYWRKSVGSIKSSFGK
jgi:hypothetical protein